MPTLRIEDVTHEESITILRDFITHMQTKHVIEALIRCLDNDDKLAVMNAIRDNLADIIRGDE